MLQELNQTLNLYSNYTVNDYGDITADSPVTIQARVGLSQITVRDSQGENVYPGIDFNAENDVEIKKGMAISYGGLFYKVELVHKTYDIDGTDFFYYCEAIQYDFGL